MRDDDLQMNKSNFNHSSTSSLDRFQPQNLLPYFIGSFVVIILLTLLQPIIATIVSIIISISLVNIIDQNFDKLYRKISLIERKLDKIY